MKALAQTVAVLLLAASSAAVAGTITYSYSGLPIAIPDNVIAGVSSTISAPDSGLITAVSLTLTFSPNHTWAGDLIATLSHGAVTAMIFDRVGKGTTAAFGDNSNLAGPYTFADGGASFAAAAAAATTAIPSGTYGAASNSYAGANGTYSTVLLNTVFGGLDRTGIWTLAVSDNSTIDTGSISAWSLNLTTADAQVPEPGSIALVGLGLVAVAFGIRRRA